jgi:hypothetical protein
MSFSLSCSVPVHSHEEWTTINRKAEDAVGRISDEAGTGFGFRDMSWFFESSGEAEEAKERLSKTDLAFAFLEVNEPEAEEEDWTSEDVP